MQVYPAVILMYFISAAVILTLSWYTLFSQTRKGRLSHSGITVSPAMEEMPSLNMPVHILKVAILPLDLPCSGPVTYSGKILTTGKSHRNKPDRIFFKHFCVTLPIANYTPGVYLSGFRKAVVTSTHKKWRDLKFSHLC